LQGAELGKGSVIAYTDDDARPDRDWIKWLRVGFREEEVGMVGGYGLPPERIDPEANEVSRLPGQACPVLVDNKNAEHLPGCNMAVRRSAFILVRLFGMRVERPMRPTSSNNGDMERLRPCC